MKRGWRITGSGHMKRLSCGMTAWSRLLPPRSALACVVPACVLVSLATCDSTTASGNPQGPDAPEVPNVELVADVVASNLDTVWEMVWGPDGFIWITERMGRISRVNPQTGAVTAVGQVPEVTENNEAGLMGLALHPDFATQPWVYVAHSYQAATRNRVVRMRFDGSTLGPPEVLLSDVPGSQIHNGSRLVVGPDQLLYVTTGDASDPTIAQNRDALAGKVLRLTLDGAPAPGNPFGNRTFSYGHRNPQGMVFANGMLYVTEHGPTDNDEVNLIQAGGKYGWPNVHGKCDGDISGESTFCAANTTVEPLAMWTPTIAPAGLAYYDSPLIPALRKSLLFTTLKDETLYRLALSADGKSVTSTETLFARQFGRLRSILVAPDGSIYIGTSNRDGRG